MIKIKEIDGFKYIGPPPSWIDAARNSNFRKNLTYMKLRFSNWEKDKTKLQFLESHIEAIQQLTEIIDSSIDSGEFDINKDVHVIIRQDDDNPNLNGGQIIIIADKKPKNINTYIAEMRELYKDVEMSYDPMFSPPRP